MQESYVVSQPVDTTGGPQIIMPSSILPDWFGVFEAPTPREAVFRYNKHGPATDYDRACDVKSFLGAISVGSGTALVLGEELLETSIVTVNDRHVLVLRPTLADEKDIDQAIAYSFGDDVAERLDRYVPTSSEHILFDSSCLGTEVPGVGVPETEIDKSVRFELTEPLYAINTYVYNPRKDVYIITHRFIPL